MAPTAVHVLVFDDFADWEPALALAELRGDAGRRIMSVSFGAASVTSMGGLQVKPDCELDEVDPATVELLLLPGGSAWPAGEVPQESLESLLHQLDTNATPIAAICGATLALARAGLLDDRAHTSNSVKYLADNVPDYAGREHYVIAPAVRDRHVITANGYGFVEFTREIFLELELASAADLDAWCAACKSGLDPFEES